MTFTTATDMKIQQESFRAFQALVFHAHISAYFLPFFPPKFEKGIENLLKKLNAFNIVFHVNEKPHNFSE